MTTSVRSEATRSVIVVNSIDVLAIGQDGTVSILNPSAAPSGNQLLTAAQQPFTKYYETTVAWTAGSAQTITHALGVIPKLVIVEAVMKSAVYGLAVGDVVSNLASSQIGSGAWNAEIRKLTTTTIQTVIGGAGLLIFNSAAGALGNYLTPAQADLRIKVFA